MDSSRLTLRVNAIRCEARDVLLIELREPNGGALPRFTAGAHIEVYLANKLTRHYSLCNDPRESDRYCIGVGLARDSRGGSKYIHENIRVGHTVSVSPPRNNFSIEDRAEEYVFIAGGIGITPIMSMIRAAIGSRRKWHLYYCARNRNRTAFYEDLTSLASPNIEFHFDDEQDGHLFNAVEALRGVPETAHIYTCGPEPLMKTVQAATSNRPKDRVHFEWFTASAVDATDDKSFKVRLARSGLELDVPPRRSILEVLEDNNCGVPYSCREGLCATCRTAVISGECDHRDFVLSPAERTSNNAIMICVSRSFSPVLELDL